MVCIPVEKVNRVLDLVAYFTNTKNKKATVHKVQKLCGYLNFLCRCVVPGRTFLRRTYSLVSPKLKAHHHVKITNEVRQDMKIWEQFLRHPDIFCQPFMDFQPVIATDIQMYSDASRNFDKGFGAICGDRWTFGVWDRSFMKRFQPSIEFLELFGVVVAVLNWIKLFPNRVIYLYCDNQSVKNMINNQTSLCKQCMRLLRFIVLEGLLRNVRIYAHYIRSKDNILSDALSRLQFQRFWKAGPHMRPLPEDVPEQIWPLDKVWLLD